MSAKVVNVLMVGTGEYTTGFVNGQASDSDKRAGVVVCTCVVRCSCVLPSERAVCFAEPSHNRSGGFAATGPTHCDHRH